MQSPTPNMSVPVSDAYNRAFSPKMLLLTGGSFAISVSLVNITKWLYVAYGYRYALFLTFTHMVASYLAAGFGLFVLKLVPNRPILSFRDQLMRVVPFSLAGTASLACANISLVYLYPSFHSMLQNSSPIWTVVFATVLQRRKYNLSGYLALIPVCGGGALCAFGEASDFALFGLICSVSAAVFRGLRAVLQGTLLSGINGKVDSISLLYYSCPFNIMLFLVASLVVEGLEPWERFRQLPMAGQSCVVGGALVAASFNIICFLMIGQLGPVGAMVMNNLKTPVIIILSCALFANAVTLKQLFGFGLSVLGAFLYDTYGREVASESSLACEGSKSYLELKPSDGENFVKGQPAPVDHTDDAERGSSEEEAPRGLPTQEEAARPLRG